MYVTLQGTHILSVLNNTYHNVKIDITLFGSAIKKGLFWFICCVLRSINRGSHSQRTSRNCVIIVDRIILYNDCLYVVLFSGDSCQSFFVLFFCHCFPIYNFDYVVVDTSVFFSLFSFVENWRCTLHDFGEWKLTYHGNEASLSCLPLNCWREIESSPYAFTANNLGSHYMYNMNCNLCAIWFASINVTKYS